MSYSIAQALATTAKSKLWLTRLVMQVDPPADIQEAFSGNREQSAPVRQQ